MRKRKLNKVSQRRSQLQQQRRINIRRRQRLATRRHNSQWMIVKTKQHQN